MTQPDDLDRILAEIREREGPPVAMTPADRRFRRNFWLAYFGLWLVFTVALGGGIWAALKNTF